MDGEDYVEEYFNEIEDEEEEGEASDDDGDAEEDNTDASEVAAALMEDDGNEDGGYQPTNPLHYIRMIRRILSGSMYAFGNDRNEENNVSSSSQNTPPPAPTSLIDERIAEEITCCTKVFPNTPLRPIPSILLQRELCRRGPLTPQDRAHIAHRFVPVGGHQICQYEHQIFCGQYSRDGSSFMSAAQDRTVRLYDSDTWALRKEIHARHIGWSVIDIDYSPDQRWIIYSSWSDYVHICNLTGNFEIHDALDFSPQADRFCLFSIKFSPDSTEILGGSSDRNLYVYDINRKERVVQVPAHSEDINTVCYLDDTGNTIVSGSDDYLIKVWDRRQLGVHSTSRDGACVGILPGHMQGITHVSPKGDGIYFISNGKDQAIKLWDIRRKMEPRTKVHHPTSIRWDYRYGGNSAAASQIHTDDKSIQTYRGHRVLQTLIRSYFSPLSTTGQKYIYTGSYDGCIYIYDVLTGGLVKKLSGHRAIIRDLSWHPYDTQITSTSWDGTIWRWNLEERNPCLGPFVGRGRRFTRSYGWDDE
jgi:WD repeat-containing protein 23